MSDASKMAYLAESRKPFKLSPPQAVAVAELQPSLSDLEKRLVRLMIAFLEKEK